MEKWKELADRVVALANAHDVERLDEERGFLITIDDGDLNSPLKLQMIFRVNISLRLELDLVVDGYLWHGETITDMGPDHYWKIAYDKIMTIEREKNSLNSSFARERASALLT